jgi:hypothetical protein
VVFRDNDRDLRVFMESLPMILRIFKGKDDMSVSQVRRVT